MTDGLLSQVEWWQAQKERGLSAGSVGLWACLQPLYQAVWFMRSCIGARLPLAGYTYLPPYLEEKLASVAVSSCCIERCF